ncbi:MAG: GNAT family N-acetyltransferase [Oscillospiraceae bacterium]|nr:GNAT family N-acetyltransferase [Oscillospiraceae bacterium]
MEIRMAQVRDIPGMIELLKQVGEVHHVIRPDIFRSGALKYDEKALEELLKDENRPIFVAMNGDFVAGYCFCILKDYRGSGVQTDRTELYIDDLCVDENRRGQGVASALYRHVCGYAKGLGCAFITLNVWCGNDGAMKFYENAGLTPRHIMMEMPLEEN